MHIRLQITICVCNSIILKTKIYKTMRLQNSVICKLKTQNNYYMALLLTIFSVWIKFIYFIYYIHILLLL